MSTVDAAALVAEAAHLDAEAAVPERAAFLSYGRCSTFDPTTDFAGPGLLSDSTAT